MRSSRRASRWLNDRVQRCAHRAMGMMVVALIASPVALHSGQLAARSDPYHAGTHGFDVSFPNCTARLGHGRVFSVVGVSGGRPFTTNPCAAPEWRASVAATRLRPALYFNTSYAAGYSRAIAPWCATTASGAGVFGGFRGRGLVIAREAWEIGCTEVRAAFATAPGTPRMWWADVETANEWSPNPRINRMTLDGISAAMRAAAGAIPTGIYSAPRMWASLTGSEAWSPRPRPDGMWIAGGSCGTVLARTRAWLSQGGLVYGVDADAAC